MTVGKDIFTFKFTASEKEKIYLIVREIVDKLQRKHKGFTQLFCLLYLY